MKKEIIESYYNKIKHFRAASMFINDINLIENVIYNFAREQSEQIISKLSLKYEKSLNTIGRFYTGVMVVHKKDTSSELDENLIDDLLYLRDCLVILGVVHVGIEGSIKQVVIKMDKANELKYGGDKSDKA